MAILDFILGRHLATDEDKDERVGPLAGVSVFGFDALSSAAYGPEAALTVLIPLGIAGSSGSIPCLSGFSERNFSGEALSCACSGLISSFNCSLRLKKL
jgi:hypothetical protein